MLRLTIAWDIKSASPWSFTNFWDNGGSLLWPQTMFVIQHMVRDTQREQTNLWWMDSYTKSTGNGHHGSTTTDDKQSDALQVLKIMLSLQSKEFERCYEDEEEYLEQKTGNRVLNRPAFASVSLLGKLAAVTTTVAR